MRKYVRSNERVPCEAASGITNSSSNSSSRTGSVDKQIVVGPASSRNCAVNAGNKEFRSTRGRANEGGGAKSRSKSQAQHTGKNPQTQGNTDAGARIQNRHKLDSLDASALHFCGEVTLIATTDVGLWRRQVGLRIKGEGACRASTHWWASPAAAVILSPAELASDVVGAWA